MQTKAVESAPPEAKKHPGANDQDRVTQGQEFALIC
jgi:hypothetical protein